MPEMLDVSLNEVETLAQKATRGAGLPWGVAEDTGRAAAWIARHVGAWAETLLALLETPPPPAESPLLLAGPLADGAVRDIPCVVAPLWALPGLIMTATQPCSIRLGDVEIRCNPGAEPGATVPPETLAALPACRILVGAPRAALPPIAMPVRHRRSRVPHDTWRRLEAFAFRTYVPATEHSRRTGAGAGLLDDE